MADTVKLLLLAADHEKGPGSQGLRLDREIRQAVAAARRGRGPNELQVASELAIGPDDLVPAVLHHEPAIVHFACHGNAQGLLFDAGALVPTDALVSLFRTYRGAHTVVLNACETLPVATALSEIVDYAIAMETMVPDRAALAFSGAFYAALAFGYPVPYAFKMGEVGMKPYTARIPATPRLCVRPGVDGRQEATVEEPEKQPEHTGGTQQVQSFAGIVVEGEAELRNEAAASAGTDVSQIGEMRQSTIRGPLKSVNTIGPSRGS
jgi:hypothetical protein